MSPKRIESSPRIYSKAFNLWKAKESAEKRKVTMDEIITDVGLAKNTVRRFLEPNGDVSGSPLSSAAIFAQYFNVSLAEVVEVENEERT